MVRPAPGPGRGQVEEGGRTSLWGSGWRITWSRRWWGMKTPAPAPAPRLSRPPPDFPWVVDQVDAVPIGVAQHGSGSPIVADKGFGLKA